jgi:hypothetical protein
MAVQFLGRAASRVEAEIVDDDLGAFVRESPRDGRAQAAGRTCDECGFSLQTPHVQSSSSWLSDTRCAKVRACKLWAKR